MPSFKILFNTDASFMQELMTVIGTYEEIFMSYL